MRAVLRLTPEVVDFFVGGNDGGEDGLVRWVSNHAVVQRPLVSSQRVVDGKTPVL